MPERFPSPIIGRTDNRGTRARCHDFEPLMDDLESVGIGIVGADLPVHEFVLE